MRWFFIVTTPQTVFIGSNVDISPLGSSRRAAKWQRSRCTELGDTFGLLAVVGAEARRTATISALGAAETLALSTTAFHQLRRQFPEISQATEALLAFQLAETSNRLVEALYAPASDRIHARLEDLARLYGPAKDGQITIPLNQEHLADLAGTTRETVNRVLHEDAASGAVVLTRNRIVISARPN